MAADERDDAEEQARDGGEQEPGPAAKDEDQDLYAAAKRRRWKRLLIAVAALALLAGVGYGVYKGFFELGHLVGRLRECTLGPDSVDRPDLSKKCNAVVDKVAAYAKSDCPRVLAEIQRVSKERGGNVNTRKASANTANLLLYALLEGRHADWETAERSHGWGWASKRTLAADACIEKAVLAVSRGPCAGFTRAGKRVCVPSGSRVFPPKIQGLASYTDPRVPFGVRMRLLAKLDPPSRLALLDEVMSQLASWLGDDPHERKDDRALRGMLQALRKRFLLPALAQVFQALAAGKARLERLEETARRQWQKGQAVVPTSILPLIPRLVEGDSAVARAALAPLTKKVLLGPQSLYNAQQAYRRLVAEASRRQAWVATLSPLLKALYARHRPSALDLLSRMDPGSPAARKTMKRFARRAIADRSRVGRTYKLDRLVERLGDVDLAVQRFLGSRTGHLAVNRVLAAMQGRLRTDGRELVRRLLAARILELVSEPDTECRELSRTRREAWILPRSRFLVEAFGVDYGTRCKELTPRRRSRGQTSSDGKVLVWPEAVLKKGRALVTAAPVDEQGRITAGLRAKLASTDIDERYFAVAALARVAPAKRRAVLRARLADPVASVRALSWFLYTWPGTAKVTAKGKTAALDPRARLAGATRDALLKRAVADKSPLARYAAFAGVLGDREALGPFAALGDPRIDLAFSVASEAWPTPAVRAWLARPDRGAAEVIYTTLRRLAGRCKPGRRLTLDAALKARLEALGRSADPYAQQEVARAVLFAPLDGLDVSAALSSRTPRVVKAALDFLWVRMRIGKAPALPAPLVSRYGPALVRLLGSPDLEVRLAVLSLLERVPVEAARAPVAALRTAPVCRVRAAAIRVLNQQGWAQTPAGKRTSYIVPKCL